MKKHSRKLLIFLIIIAIIGSIFYLYKNMKLTKAFTYFAPIINSAKEKVSAKGEAILDKKINDVKNAAFTQFKSGVNTGIDKIGELIGAEQVDLPNNNQIANINSQININKEINRNCQ